MLTKLCRAALISTLLLATSAAMANQPTREMTMQQVKAQFGAPDSIKPAVGNPPITRWVYADYTVYFEGNLTLDTVENHPIPKAAPPTDEPNKDTTQVAAPEKDTKKVAESQESTPK